MYLLVCITTLESGQAGKQCMKFWRTDLLQYWNSWEKQKWCWILTLNNVSLKLGILSNYWCAPVSISMLFLLAKFPCFYHLSPSQCHLKQDALLRKHAKKLPKWSCKCHCSHSLEHKGDCILMGISNLPPPSLLWLQIAMLYTSWISVEFESLDISNQKLSHEWRKDDGSVTQWFVCGMVWKSLSVQWAHRIRASFSTRYSI